MHMHTLLFVFLWGTLTHFVRSAHILWTIALICIALGHQPPFALIFPPLFLSSLREHLTCAHEQSSHSPLRVAVCCVANQDSTAGTLARFLLCRRHKTPVALKTHHLRLIFHKVSQENSTPNFCPQLLSIELRPGPAGWAQSRPYIAMFISATLHLCLATGTISLDKKILGAARGQPDTQSPLELNYDLGC